jgi:hypothetical protein
MQNQIDSHMVRVIRPVVPAYLERGTRGGLPTRRSMLCAVAFVLAAISWPVSGEDVPAKPFAPSLGDLMTAFVQPRHAKLGLAGQARNWALAAYEVGELEETFEGVEEYYPRWQGRAIGDMVAAFTGAPIKALEAAVKSKDAAAFDKSYAELTAACNACHVANGQGVIVIQAPASSAYPDQDFRPRTH